MSMDFISSFYLVSYYNTNSIHVGSEHTDFLFLSRA
jgi:hypothetical protein